MPLAFRNLTVTPKDPVACWPTEAVETALERGDLDDWRRIVAELEREPWGRTARQVEEILSHTRPYGIADVLELILGRARERTESGERAAVAAEVRSAIASSGVTAAEFASRIGTSTSRLSTYATGRVTPSAALMLRIRRLVERIRSSDASADVGEESR